MTPRKSPLFLVTGTDTGAGKTVLTALLVASARRLGLRMRAVKPFCSGGRADAEVLHRVQGGELTLDDINPWHFHAALTPMLAARRAGVRVELDQVLGFLRAARRGADPLLVEGAGGLLSPLGEDYDVRDLIRALRAIPVVVAPNRLGAINQVLLVTEALGSALAVARVALMAPVRRDVVSRTNLAVLRERLGSARVIEVPRLTHPETPAPGVAVARSLIRWLAI